MKHFFRIYLVPGFVFQSVVIGGGYATGRELIEFFFDSGPVGGILGLLVAGLIFGTALAVAFEFARLHKTHDYRSFCKALLGRLWVVYEVAYLFLLILVLSIIATAAGELVHERFGLPTQFSTLLLALIIGLLTYFGTDTIRRVLAAWSILLYTLYLSLFALTFYEHKNSLISLFASAPSGENWIEAGIMYSGYNLAILPIVLFAVKSHTARHQSVISGFIGGMLAVIPAILFFTSMMSHYPEIADSTIPSAVLMSGLSMPIFALIFQLVILGTFVETGAALLHALTERLESFFQEAGRSFPKTARPVIAIGGLLLAVLLGNHLGMVALIAKGYSALTILFIFVLIVPLFTIGIWKIRRANSVLKPQQNTN